MIAYEDVLTRDARMYWDGACVFKVDPSTYEVTAYHLRVPRSADEDGDNPAWAEQFAESECTLSKFIRRGQRHVTISAYGSALLSYPEWTISRVPIEYVPINNGERLVRASADGGRRAYKGLGEHTLRWLCLLDPSDQPRPRIHHSLVESMTGLRSAATFQELALGIAEVMSIGTPAAVRRVMPEDVAYSRAKDTTRLFFTDTRRVLVPDFPVALIKHRSKDDEALVLFRGTYAGRLVNKDDELVYYGSGRMENRDARRAYKAGLSLLAKRLFADRVVWS